MSISHSTVAVGTNDSAKQVSVNAWNDVHFIDFDGVDLPHTGAEPAPPPDDHVKLFAQKLGRMMVAIMGPTGVDTTLQPHLGRNGWYMWIPLQGAATITAYGIGALTATGTATAATYAVTNVFTRSRRVDFIAGAAGTTAIAGFRFATLLFRLQDGFHMVARVGGFQGVTIASHRFFCGMATQTTAPTDVQPSTQVNMIGVGYDSADVNIQVMHNDATGTAVKIDTGIVVPTANATDIIAVNIFSGPAGASIGVTVMNETTGARFDASISSADIPALTLGLAPRAFLSAGGTSTTPGLSLFSLYMETDN